MPQPRQLAFPVSEYKRRVAAVQANMAERKLDLMLATTMASVCYLTGLESVSPHKLWLVGVPQKGNPVIVCQDFESHNAKLSAWLDAEFQYGVFERPHETILRMIKTVAGARFRGRIGFEMLNFSSLSTADYLALRDALPEAEFVDATDCVGAAMAIKSDAEIACMREAGRITAVAMDDTLNAILPGRLDNEVAATAYDALIRRGSEYSSYPVIVTTGHRSGVPHSTFRRVPIKPGDPVFIEIAGCVNRYQTPKMRVAVMGEPHRELKKLADAAVASVDAMVENIKPGVRAKDVAAKSARALRGLPKRIVWHGYYGYSVGLGFPPEWSDCMTLYIGLKSDAVLQPGMTFHCSTSLRDIGVRGATCSETILVTKTGCEVLTDSKRELVLRPA